MERVEWYGPAEVSALDRWRESIANLNFILEDIDVFDASKKHVTAALCYICIAIYGIRCCVQPMLLLFRAWPVFKGKSSFTEVWDADVRWFEPYSCTHVSTIDTIPSMQQLPKQF